MWIQELLWDADTEDKLASKHGVRLDEVADVCFGEHYERRGRENTHLLFGQTSAGRYLMVVLGPRPDRRAKLITAREMTDAERRAYQEAR